MATETPYLEINGARVEGCMAEILTVLDESALWERCISRAVSIADVMPVLDTRRPAEERVSGTIKIINDIRSTTLLGAWIPWYGNLPGHEYGNQFYPAYRDHTIHTLQVFLLGVYFFETVSTLRDSLLFRLRQVTATTELPDAELFHEWWALTSIWHDNGYPFEADSFLANSEIREAILDALSTALGNDPFTEAFQLRGINLTPSLRREIYRGGSFYPFEFFSASQVLTQDRVAKVLNKMWHRLGVGLEVESPLSALDQVTTQDPAGRPPFHDHGLLGAALLSFLAEEAESFLTHLLDNVEDTNIPEIIKAKVRDVTENAWESFIGLDSLVRLAIEAIGFHNISFAQLNASRSAKRLIPTGYETQISLQAEPHLFFLCLVDTLQDWGRHHFVPNESRVHYRPSTPASDVLLQGNAGKILIDLKQEDNPTEVVNKIFSGWLAREETVALFGENPGFTFPNRISAAVPGSLDSLRRSQEEKVRLRKVITENTQQARKILIQGETNSIVSASVLLESALRQFRDSDSVLSFSDKEDLEQHLNEAGLDRLRRQAYALIEPGTQLSLGTVTKKLGDGGFGTVFHVESESREKEYAFKLFHDRDLLDEEKLRLFRRGYEAMRALNDQPHVVGVYSFSEVPLGFYMEFIPGQNLEEGIDQLKTIHERIKVALQVAETVAEAHNRSVQVLHRDIKPGNVLLDFTDNLNPILTDFDLAWIESRRTELTKQLYANFHYGAPEQFEPRWREFKQQPTVDVYSLGALTYFLLLKQPPPHWNAWSQESWNLLEERLEGKLDAPVVFGLQDLLRSMVEPDPRKRLQDMEKVARELGRLVTVAQTGGGSTDQETWCQQVAYKVTGHSQSDGRRFNSRTGRTSWKLVTKTAGKGISLQAEVTLVGKPTFEGVDYNGYRIKAARRIDERLKSFEKEYENVRSYRRGFPTENSSATLYINGLDCTLETATILGQLLSQINRSLE